LNDQPNGLGQIGEPFPIPEKRVFRRYRPKVGGQKKGKENRFGYGSAYLEELINKTEEA